MKFSRNRLIAVAAGVMALGLGIVGAQAATAPSTGKNYAQVFVDKLAGILHLSSSQTQADLKAAQLQTVDQMLKDGQITQAQADAMKAGINAGQGLGFGFAPRARGFGAPGNRALSSQLKTAEMTALTNALHLTAAQLQAQVQAGKSLSDIESAQKVKDADVRAAVKKAARGVLDPSVKAGTITQAQEDQVLQGIDTGRIGFGFGHRSFRGGGIPFAPGAGGQAPGPLFES